MSGWSMSVRGLDSVVGLLESVRTEFDGSTAYLVGPTVRYAVFQEYGTSKMDARPFVRPAAAFVEANMASEVQRIASSQGITLNSERDVVRCAALAVQDRMRRIANQKDIRESGQLIGSIRVKPVS